MWQSITFRPVCRLPHNALPAAPNPRGRKAGGLKSPELPRDFLPPFASENGMCERL